MLRNRVLFTRSQFHRNISVIIGIILLVATIQPANVSSQGETESFEDTSTNWIVDTDSSGIGSTVTRSSEQRFTDTFSAVTHTTNSHGKAQVRDVILGNWSDVPYDAPGSFIWQHAYLYVPSSTANALTDDEYLDLGATYVSDNSSGFFLRLKASRALYASAPGSTGQTEFNLYATLPLDQWVEIELGLWSRNTGDLDRAGSFLVNGRFYGWFSNAESDTNYDHIAMGIVSTNSNDDLTVYIDDWHIYSTNSDPTGNDNRPTESIYIKDYTEMDGENVGYHYTTWENGYAFDDEYGLSTSIRIQSGIETSKMPDLSDGWSQIVIDWTDGNIPPWPPEGIGEFFAPMVAFRKSVELEENLEIVPVYRNDSQTVDLVFESWTLGPIEYATWPLPTDIGGHQIPGQDDIIRVRWQEVNASEIRVRVDYYDASADIWTLDAIDHTEDLSNVNGVNFLADTHQAVTNTIDSDDYTIKSQTIGILETFDHPTNPPMPTSASSNTSDSTPTITSTPTNLLIFTPTSTPTFPSITTKTTNSTGKNTLMLGLIGLFGLLIIMIGGVALGYFKRRNSS